MEKKFDSIRQDGRELLRLTSTIEGAEMIPDGLADFCRELSSRAIKGARSVLEEHILTQYEIERKNGNGFRFRAYDYSIYVTCLSVKKNISEIEIKINLKRGGEELFSLNRSLCFSGELIAPFPSKPPKRRKSLINRIRKNQSF